MKKWQDFYDIGNSLKMVSEHFGIPVHKLRYKIKTRSYSDAVKLAYKTGRKTNEFSEKTLNKLSDIAIKRGFGGKNYKNNVYYNGIRLESSYELKVAKSLDEHNIKWIVRPKRFELKIENKKKYYTPDFYLPEFNVYLDPKNDFLIKTDSDKIKLVEQKFNIKVIILNKDQLSWYYIYREIIQNAAVV